MNQLLLLLAIIPLLMLATISNVYASGPRLDYDERYEDVPGAPGCWVDGYDAGFAQKYDKDRADECNDIPGDQYNASWGYGCIDSGLAEADCNDIQDNPQDIENHEALQEENRRACYDDGYEDGMNSNSFNKVRESGCSEYSSSYESGFSAGCQSLEGNTYDICELTIEGHEIYCPDNRDDLACTDFLHDVSNKKPLPPKSGSVCDGPTYHPGCPQIHNPERYCLVTDDPAFCKTIGDICDADGFVKPEDAYCTK